ncbi:alpha/beta hydrolase [Mariniradius sediminis]|uniref:Alpha/beta hydrolase n=1 Tax=Mariniradius sediminis TaxID=2909237 RepID=A0ABS9BSU3_9BACT|nr:alpha/beta hydrolase [Mariniradius sediminis]MCF1750552.1 alpha/beta hydrolase [Mariniradius sediminis]
MSRAIFVFSGLGADERVFRKIQFQGFLVTHVKWIPPLQNESIDSYAKRILTQVASPNPILVGLSFGGIMAIEVAKLIGTEKVILISSAKNRDEIPFYLRLAGSIRLHRLIPAEFLKSSNFLSNWFFGAETPEEKALLKNILEDTDPAFLKWAIDKILTWSHSGPNPIQINHLHGDRDRILPIRFVQGPISIKGGGHLMTLDKHEEINWSLDIVLKTI